MTSLIDNRCLGVQDKLQIQAIFCKTKWKADNVYRIEYELQIISIIRYLTFYSLIHLILFSALFFFSVQVLNDSSISDFFSAVQY